MGRGKRNARKRRAEQPGADKPKVTERYVKRQEALEHVATIEHPPDSLSGSFPPPGQETRSDLRLLFRYWPAATGKKKDDIGKRLDLHFDRVKDNPDLFGRDLLRMYEIYNAEEKIHADAINEANRIQTHYEIELKKLEVQKEIELAKIASGQPNTQINVSQQSLISTMGHGEGLSLQAIRQQLIEDNEQLRRFGCLENGDGQPGPVCSTGQPAAVAMG